MKLPAGLVGQSLVAAAVAAYVGAFLAFTFSLVWRIQTGADARMCPIGARGLSDLCTIAELSGAFLFNFLWAGYGLPFGLVLTFPCALALGGLAPSLERKLSSAALARVQYVSGAAAGIFAIALLEVIERSAPLSVEKIADAIVFSIAGLAGAWAFRWARYPR